MPERSPGPGSAGRFSLSSSFSSVGLFEGRDIEFPHLQKGLRHPAPPFRDRGPAACRRGRMARPAATPGFSDFAAALLGSARIISENRTAGHGSGSPRPAALTRAEIAGPFEKPRTGWPGLEAIGLDADAPDKRLADIPKKWIGSGPRPTGQGPYLLRGRPGQEAAMITAARTASTARATALPMGWSAG
ncbi:MAG: hypothetical protein MZU91_11020 [Desulfosudis oleivorans]|nr:hypothetical protein [Desulfosudis oleivorans]